MLTTESLVSYQGRLQELNRRLEGKDYTIPDAHRWGIMSYYFISVYTTIFRMVNPPLINNYYERNKKFIT